MRTFRLHKLVRDKIIEQNVSEGAQIDSRKLDDTEYLAALKAKLLEEANELPLDNREEILKELADVAEVLDALIEASGVSQEELRRKRETRSVKVGVFKNRDFIETITLPDDNRWVEYYASQPDRFLEIPRSDPHGTGTA